MSFYFNSQVNFLDRKIIKKIKIEQKGKMCMAKLLSPKNDYVFKRLFGFVGNEEITKDFLKVIMKTEISDIALDGNRILEQDLETEKFGILDIRVKIEENIECDIEMQVIDRKMEQQKEKIIKI